MDDIGN